MPTCEVCSKEASKYKCPTCGLLSCSLGCTKSHKAHCAPKPDKTAVKESAERPSEDQQSLAKQEEPGEAEGPLPLAEIQKLFTEYPNLRNKLREIYKITLEEEWDAEQRHSTNHRGDRQPYNHHPHSNNRGAWTAERGFNRGIGKVRRWREGCESGECMDADAEGFVKFMALIAEERDA